MLLLAGNLPADKYRVSLACASRQKLNPWCQKFLERDMNVMRLKVFHKHDPRHFLYLKNLLPQYDLLHAHVWNPASCRYAMLAANKTPLVITEHDPFPLSGIKGWLKIKLLNNVRRIIVASNAAKRLAAAQDPTIAGRITVVPNGIDTKVWEMACKLEDRKEFRMTHFGAAMNEKVILCVAELHERKGQKYLIEAFSNLIKNFPNTKLVFVGEGRKRKHYEKLAKPFGNKILFLGHRREIPQMMAASDIFVLPSIREAFGLVILEAAIAGVPTVATTVGGIPEIIEDLKTGILVPPAEPELMEKAIRAILQNPSGASELAKAAKSRTETLFNAKTMAELTSKVYDEILLTCSKKQ